MGMFDYFNFENDIAQLADFDYKNEEFQTKDLHCNLDEYVAMEDGTITRNAKRTERGTEVDDDDWVEVYSNCTRLSDKKIGWLLFRFKIVDGRMGDMIDVLFEPKGTGGKREGGVEWIYAREGDIEDGWCPYCHYYVDGNVEGQKCQQCGLFIGKLEPQGLTDEEWERFLENGTLSEDPEVIAFARELLDNMQAAYERMLHKDNGVEPFSLISIVRQSMDHLERDPEVISVQRMD